MCELSNSRRSDSEGKTSWEDGDLAGAFTGQDYYQRLIAQANSVSIYRVIKYYNPKLTSGVTKIICPFKSHKGGREKTPSFQIFPETNSFYCYGCTAGSKTTDFVCKLEGTSKVDAAHKILSLFESSFDDSNFLDIQDVGETLELMIKFSSAVRIFRQSHFDEKSEVFIEHICSLYDQMNHKHKLTNNERLKSTIGKFIYIIDSYSPCYKL
jgi:hypothetical protein